MSRSQAAAALVSSLVEPTHLPKHTGTELASYQRRGSRPGYPSHSALAHGTGPIHDAGHTPQMRTPFILCFRVWDFERYSWIAGQSPLELVLLRRSSSAPRLSPRLLSWLGWSSKWSHCMGASSHARLRHRLLSVEWRRCTSLGGFYAGVACHCAPCSYGA